MVEGFKSFKTSGTNTTSNTSVSGAMDELSEFTEGYFLKKLNEGNENSGGLGEDLQYENEKKRVLQSAAEQIRQAVGERIRERLDELKIEYGPWIEDVFGIPQIKVCIASWYEIHYDTSPEL